MGIPVFEILKWPESELKYQEAFLSIDYDIINENNNNENNNDNEIGSMTLEEIKNRRKEISIDQSVADLDRVLG